MKNVLLSRVSALSIVLAALAGGAPLGWAQTPKAADPSAAELLFWETIRGSANPADFEEYLKQYPNGKFAGLARIRAQAKPAAQPAASPAPAVGAAKTATAPTRDASRLPPAGARWKYRYTDHKYSLRGKHEFDVRIDSLEDGVMNETLSFAGAKSVSVKRTGAGAESLRFTAQRLPENRTLLEFAPYLRLPDLRLVTPVRVDSSSGYPMSGNVPTDWKVSVSALADAPVTVPAGTFQASRIEVRGARRMPSLLFPSRFRLIMWYAPEVKRYVRAEHKAWAEATVVADEVGELLQFSGVAPQ
jgi:hypothetical protein